MHPHTHTHTHDSFCLLLTGPCKAWRPHPCGSCLATWHAFLRINTRNFLFVASLASIILIKVQHGVCSLAMRALQRGMLSAHESAHTHTHARMHARTHARTHAHTHTHTHACTRTHAHTRTHACTRTHVHTRTHSMTHARAHTQGIIEANGYGKFFYT
jgi:ABC-type Zn2+ transport system substrate-binding protein/surface adhesin